jgi:hypothetical protein
VLVVCGSGQFLLLCGTGRRLSPSSSRSTCVLSFRLKRVLSPNDRLDADRGLREDSGAGDADPYPESLEESEVSLLAINLEAGVR